MKFPYRPFHAPDRRIYRFAHCFGDRHRRRCAHCSALADKSATNREALSESFSGFQIAYEHVAELVGLRPRAKDIAPDVNAFWQNQSFHNYAD
jgi:hypothetical protein